jgi:hypothetical protein
MVFPIDQQGALIQPLLSSTDASIKGASGQPARGNAARITSWVLIGTGSALGVGGGFFYVHSLKPASAAKDILNKYGGDEDRARKSVDAILYQAALNRKQDRQKTAIVMGASAAVTLATGMVLFFALPPTTEEAPRFNFAPHFGTDGGGVALMGRF